jgi:3-oxoadipate enol-lactonase
VSETPARGTAADSLPGPEYGSSLSALPNARRRHASNGDVILAWEEVGDGPPVLLIHGLGYDRRGWGPAPRILADTFRMVTFDNRGVGDSGAPPGPYSTATMAADALAVLDDARVERVHLVGTSLGGMVAQELALSWPDRIETLVLTATTPGGDDGVPMPQRSVELFAEFGEDPSQVNLRRIVENSLSAQTVATRPELVAEIFDYRLNHPPRLDGWHAQAAAGRTFASLSSLHELDLPTLVIHGTDDNVVDYRNAALLVRAIPGAELVSLPDAGHLCFWERPSEFASTVRAFVERHSSQAARR